MKARDRIPRRPCARKDARPPAGATFYCFAMHHYTVVDGTLDCEGALPRPHDKMRAPAMPRDAALPRCLRPAAPFGAPAVALGHGVRL